MAFYKGTTSPLAGIAVIVSVQFSTNEVLKRIFFDINQKTGKDNIYKLSTTQLLLSGGAGGFTGGFVAAPVEHIRIRLQVQTGPESSFLYKSCLDAAKKIYASNSMKGIFRGLTSTWYRDCIGYGKTIPD